MKNTKSLISFVRYLLHFMIGASWAITVLGAVFVSFKFYFVASWITFLIGASIGLFLLLLFYTILYIFELNVKLRN
ncbi:MAG: hypothetical protein ACOCMW_06250, partial [Campylobacter hyointestinalis]